MIVNKSVFLHPLGVHLIIKPRLSNLGRKAPQLNAPICGGDSFSKECKKSTKMGFYGGLPGTLLLRQQVSEFFLHDITI